MSARRSLQDSGDQLCICRQRLILTDHAVTDFNKQRYFYSNTNGPSACGEGKRI